MNRIWLVAFIQVSGHLTLFPYLLSWIFCRLYRMWKSLSSCITPADNISSTRASSRLSRAEGQKEVDMTNVAWK